MFGEQERITTSNSLCTSFSLVHITVGSKDWGQSKLSCQSIKHLYCSFLLHVSIKTLACCFCISALRVKVFIYRFYYTGKGGNTGCLCVFTLAEALRFFARLWACVWAYLDVVWRQICPKKSAKYDKTSIWDHLVASAFKYLYIYLYILLLGFA